MWDKVIKMIFKMVYSTEFNCLFQKYKMNFDKNTGIIEMFMESLGKEDEGTYTFQLQDGKATNQSSLVLIGNGTHFLSPYYHHTHIHTHFTNFTASTKVKQMNQIYNLSLFFCSFQTIAERIWVPEERMAQETR